MQTVGRGQTEDSNPPPHAIPPTEEEVEEVEVISGVRIGFEEQQRAALPAFFWFCGVACATPVALVGGLAEIELLPTGEGRLLRHLEQGW